MRRLEPRDLVRIWEAGTPLHPIDRALLILGSQDAARLPLGTRDARLLEIRAATLGDRLEATDECPECGERVDVSLSCRALGGGIEPPPERWTLEHGDVRITVRPLDSHDAAAAVATGDGAAELLTRAVVAVEPAGPLPPDAAAAVTASLSEHDPGAELLIELTCPACTASWQRVLDVAGFVWTELEARAQRLLGDVHALASAYGWTEDEVLALGDARRAAYLAMVEG
jgi:hypothetical protein